MAATRLRLRLFSQGRTRRAGYVASILVFLCVVHDDGWLKRAPESYSRLGFVSPPRVSLSTQKSRALKCQQRFEALSDAEDAMLANMTGITEAQRREVLRLSPDDTKPHVDDSKTAGNQGAFSHADSPWVVDASGPRVTVAMGGLALAWLGIGVAFGTVVLPFVGSIVLLAASWLLVGTFWQDGADPLNPAGSEANAMNAVGVVIILVVYLAAGNYLYWYVRSLLIGASLDDSTLLTLSSSAGCA